MPVRLADIARHAGVSEATVSRVMNDRPGVTEDKRRAVLLALDELGYDRPSKLRERSRRRVGVLVPEPLSGESLELAQHLVANFARRSIIGTIALVGAGGATAEELVRAFEEMGCSAVVGVDLEAVDALALPPRAALVGSIATPGRLAFVTPERARLALAARHLSDLGHRRALLVVPHGAAAPEVDPVLELTVIVAPAGREAGDVAVRRAQEIGVTAIITTTPAQALGVAAVDGASGSFAIIALHDDASLADRVPGVSGVTRSAAAIAVAAVDSLVGDMNGIPATPEEFSFPPLLSPRDSTRLKFFAE